MLRSLSWGDRPALVVGREDGTEADAEQTLVDGEEGERRTGRPGHHRSEGHAAVESAQMTSRTRIDDLSLLDGAGDGNRTRAPGSGSDGARTGAWSLAVLPNAHDHGSCSQLSPGTAADQGEPLKEREPRLPCPSSVCPAFQEVAWWRGPLQEGGSMPWFIWLIAAAALGAAEFFTLTLFFGLLAGAALVAAVVAGVGVGLLGQLVALGAAAAAGLVIVRPVALRHMEQQPLTREGSDALIGKRAEVMQEVTATRGLVKLSGEEWSARAFDESLVIPVGALVDVMEIEGATAIVYPRELLP